MLMDKKNALIKKSIVLVLNIEVFQIKFSQK